MLLLLIRHAQAAEQSPTDYPDDRLRPLVPKGRKTQRRISRELRRRKLIPDRVLSSPWKRAWQTARIVVEETGLPRRAREECLALAEAPELAALAGAIGATAADETIALVGHEPWMSELAGLLLTGSPAGLSVDFAKSGVMGIDAPALEPRAGSLRFFLVP